jgi:hypothetical protein
MLNSCGTTPTIDFALAKSSSMLIPNISTSPDVLFIRSVMIPIMVVFPAPLIQSKAKKSQSCISRFMFLSA